MKNLSNLNLIKGAWSKETAHPTSQPKWTKDNPALGQCAVTALLVQDEMGGDIGEIMVGRTRHFFNIIDGKIVDLTSSQFDDNVRLDYSNIGLRDRKMLQRSVQDRYELLKQNYARLKNENLGRENFMKFTLSESAENGKNDLREQVADLCHKQWSGWMEYLFSKCTTNEDGTVTIPKASVDRWKRQMGTDYEDLPEKEQDSDRTEADKFLLLLKT